ncbi:MAG: peptidylprolyl isomerase [Pseudomonadales bacterium]
MTKPMPTRAARAAFRALTGALRRLCLGLCLALAVPLPSALAAEPVRVTLDSDAGVIELALYPDRAPLTVANFLRYVDAGLYDGASFYRVVRQDNQPQSPVKIEVIQGGMGAATYDAEPAQRPFPPVAHETTAVTGLRHEDGTLSMARLAPGSATSEFFICIGPQPELDFGGARNPDGQGFAAFGRVISGMDVVRRIQGEPTRADAPDYLSSVTGQLLQDPVIIQHAERAGSVR